MYGGVITIHAKEPENDLWILLANYLSRMPQDMFGNVMHARELDLFSQSNALDQHYCERSIRYLRTINKNQKEWADKLDDALWEFRTAYKSPIGSTPFRIVYGKACLLLIEMDHKAYWALKNANLDLDVAGRNRFLQLNKLVEMRNKAYEHSRTYKERTKRWHDARIPDKEFQEGEEDLVFNSRLKLFSSKLKTRWYGPYTVSIVFPYGTIEVSGKDGIFLKVNGHRSKSQEIDARDHLGLWLCG
ncbi:reverse transcriptase domain-containing protein [Tanacetum coccineum]